MDKNSQNECVGWMLRIRWHLLTVGHLSMWFSIFRLILCGKIMALWASKPFRIQHCADSPFSDHSYLRLKHYFHRHSHDRDGSNFLYFYQFLKVDFADSPNFSSHRTLSGPCYWTSHRKASLSLQSRVRTECRRPRIEIDCRFIANHHTFTQRWCKEYSLTYLTLNVLSRNIATV